MMKRISVIIPAYNAEKYIERCLKSVANQTYGNLQIIVINDGSADRTGMLADAFAETDERVMVIHQDNAGVSAARNRGMEIANGDHIGFVDSDDELYPEMYATLVEDIERYNADISHCGFELITPNGKKLFYGTEKVMVQTAAEALVSMVNDHLFEPSACIKLYKRNVVEDIRFNQEIKFNEDLLFNVEAFRKAGKIVFHDVIMYSYMHNTCSASQSSPNDQILRHVIAAAGLVRQKLSGLIPAQNVNRFFVGKLLAVYQSIYKKDSADFSFKGDVKNKLSNSGNLGLSAREVFIKYALLYFPGVFTISKLIYDQSLGRHKKWDID